LPDQHNSLVVVRLQGFFCFNSKKSFILDFTHFFKQYLSFKQYHSIIPFSNDMKPNGQEL